MRAIMKRLALFAAVPVVLSLAAACSSSTRSNVFEDDAGTGPSSPTPGDGGSLFGDGGVGPSGDPCVPNPANAEIPANGCDDDGDGKVDNPPACDTGLARNGNATEFAKSLGICADAAQKGYGLVSATYTRGTTTTTAPRAGQTGILPKFGNVIVPREGATLGVISTGWAREFNQDTGSTQLFGQNAQLWDTAPSRTVPAGFPKAAAACPSTETDTYDVVDVKLVLKAPPNAKGIAFDFNFFTSEWPAFVCTDYNDSFIAYLSSKAFNGGKPDNISFDAQKNPVSVNNGFFDRCTPNTVIGCADGPTTTRSQCPGGPGELAGTGFAKEDLWCGPFSNTRSSAGGATGWLTSTAPVEPGETFTLEFLLWDTGDADLDSVTLLDNFRWVQGDTKTETARPR